MSQQHAAARKLPGGSCGGSPRGTVQQHQARAAGSLPSVPTPLHERGARGQGHVPGSSIWAVAAATTRWNKLENETTICKEVESHPCYSHGCRVCPVQTTPLKSGRDRPVKSACARLDPGKITFTLWRCAILASDKKNLQKRHLKCESTPLEELKSLVNPTDTFIENQTNRLRPLLVQMGVTLQTIEPFLYSKQQKILGQRQK